MASPPRSGERPRPDPGLRHRPPRARLAAPFYNHFEDKEACFVELMKGLADAFLEAVDRAIDRGQPISVQIDQAVDTYLALVTGDPDLTSTFAARTSVNGRSSRCAKASSATRS